jgi:hypothetical protein
LGGALLLIALEGRYLVLFRDVSHLAVVGNICAHLVKRFFLVIVTFKHFLGFIHVFLGNLFWSANGCIRNASWLAFTLLPLVHNQIFNASE